MRQPRRFLMMSKLIFIYSFLFLLSGCFLDQEGKDQSSVEVKLTENLVSGAAGGAILYLVNKDSNIQRSMILTESSLNVQLKQGTWDFAIVAWTGDGSANQNLTGSIKCGLQKGVKLDEASESVSLNFNTSTCNNSFFTPPAHLASGSMQAVTIVNCLTVTNPTPGTYCDSAAIGFAGSYKIKIFAKPNPTPKNKTSFIAALGAHVLNPPTSGVQVLESSCIPASTGAMSTTPVFRVLPFSSPDLFVSAGVEAYSDTSCSSGKQSYIYPIGLGDPSGNVGALTSNTVSKTTATSSSSDIYLAYQPVTLSMSNNDFGKVLFSQPGSKTLIITNNSLSSVTLSIPSYSDNQFSNGLTNCLSTLAANAACSRGVIFTPTSKGISTSTVSVSINGQPKTLTLTGFGVQDRFKTYPQAVTGFQGLPSNVINSVFQVYFGSTIVKLVGTDGGFYRNSGPTIDTKTTAINYNPSSSLFSDKFGSNIINTTYAFSNNGVNYVYVGTTNGLAISIDGGDTYSNYLTGNDIKSIFAHVEGTEKRLYVGTNEAIKVSLDGGASWALSTTVSGGVQKLFVDTTTPSTPIIYMSNNNDSFHSLPLSISSGTITPLTSSQLDLSFFDPSTSTTTVSSDAKVSDIRKNSNGEMYLLVSTGSSISAAIPGIYKYVSGIWSHQSDLNVTGAVEYSQMAEDHNGHFLIGKKNVNQNSLIKYNPGSNNFSPLSLGSYNEKITGISTYLPNTTTTSVLIGTKSGIIQTTVSTTNPTTTYTSFSTLTLTPTSGFKNNKINSLAVKEGTTNLPIIIGTSEGILLNNTPATLSGIAHGFPGHDVKAMFSNTTNIYFGSKSTNNYVERSPWAGLSANSFTARASSFSSEVNDIFVDVLTEYVATQGAGVAYLDIIATAPSWQWINTSTTNGSLLDNNIKNIYVDSGGVLYLTYSSGNSVFDAKVAKVVITSGGMSPTYSISHHSLVGMSSGETIVKLYVDDFGKVFVGTSQRNIKRWNSLADLTSATPVTPVNFQLPLSGGVSPTINDIVAKWSGTTNHLFVATNFGIYINVDSSFSTNWKVRTTLHGLPTNNIKKVFVDSNYDIYIGANGDNTEDSGGGLATTKY